MQKHWGVLFFAMGRTDMSGFRSCLQKSALEKVITLILLAILAGLVGGGMVGLATDHKAAASSTAGTGLGGQ